MITDRQVVIRQAAEALDQRREIAAIPLVETAAIAAGSDPALWQWLGLLHRSMDRRDAAIPAFERAAALAPEDAKIAQGLARVLLEAGLPAVDAFQRVLSLTPNDGDALLGHAAAQLAVGEGEAAITVLDDVLRANPLWLAGHRERIQLGWMLGRGDAAFEVWRGALAHGGSDPGLWQIGIQANIDARRYDFALADIARGRAQSGGGAFFDFNEAVVLSELGQTVRADRAFLQTAAFDEPVLALHRIRHAMRNGRMEEAGGLLEPWLGKPHAEVLWPYADILWRLTGDPRRVWLHWEGSIQVIDLADRLPDLAPLADCLRRLHQSRHEHLDQSVRGGTQTDGALFARVEPEIRALRQAMVEAVTGYVALLPICDPSHPLLGRRRESTPRFAGSWSVRLAGAGFHANHVHPQGWISSALYVSLPAGRSGHEGWLALGQPQAELGLDLAPTQMIEPKPGRLVLFPSTMWHGTVPFPAGERLTVAFDVAAPLE